MTILYAILGTNAETRPGACRPECPPQYYLRAIPRPWAGTCTKITLNHSPISTVDGRKIWSWKTAHTTQRITLLFLPIYTPILAGSIPFRLPRYRQKVVRTQAPSPSAPSRPSCLHFQSTPSPGGTDKLKRLVQRQLPWSIPQ